MARFLAVLFAVFVLVTTIPVYAKGSYTPLGMEPGQTDDPNHKGYGIDDEEIFPFEWKPVAAECDPCKTLAEAYNKTMRQLLYTRYWIREINEEIGDRDQRHKWQRAMDRARDAKADGMDAVDERRASAEMNYQEGVDIVAGKLPALEAQEESLTALADDLRAQLEACESKMCRGPAEQEKFIKAGNDAAQASPLLPFDWKGPYPEACHKCAKLSARLNELPTLARNALAGLEAARADLMSAETEIAIIQVDHDGIVFSYEGDTRSPEEILKEHKENEKQVKKDLAAMERMKEEAEQEIAKYETDLDKIIQNFNETLKLYNDCVPTCTPETKTGYVDPVKTGEYALGAGVDLNPDKCFAKINYDGFVIGANSQYGTGAQMKEKAQDMATGAAMGALNSVLGGGGITLGGGGRGKEGGGMQAIDPPGSPGGNSDGPRLDKNPLGKGEYQPFEWTGFYIGAQAGFTPDGLVLNEKIEKSPDGNSTFHATWLQDEKGRTILPTSYYVYDIYRDHKLTVWWTYDHWTDGVHDAHDEGRETTQWREDLGSFKIRFGGEKGIENSLWYQSGFNTAVKGVRQMGALYAGITPEDLGGCGLNAVTHLTLPSQDPVITTPFVLNLRTAAEKAADDAAFTRSIMMTMPPF